MSPKPVYMSRSGALLNRDVDDAVTTPSSVPVVSEMDKWLKHGCLAVAFLIPLKLSLTYVVLIPLVATWVITNYRAGTLLERFQMRDVPAASKILTPLYFFTLALFLSSAVGLNPGHSLRPLVSFCFFLMTVFVFAQHGNPRTILSALICGQSIAGLHSVIDAAMPDAMSSWFIGKVTESGQLAISILLALGLAWYRPESTLKGADGPSLPRSITLIAIAITLILSAVGFRAEAHLSNTLVLAMLGILLALYVGVLYLLRKKNPELKACLILIGVELPLLVAAVLVNLKRGPWFGVTIGALIFLSYFAPRLLRSFLAVVVACIIFVGPIRDRMAESYDHFFISGGRSTIWRIGSELTAKYPLGVGFHNSEILRKFAPEIPPELKHFHNNLLNIATESGWLSMAIFAWLIISVVRVCFAKPLDPVRVAIGCGIISWQVAGVVEYNVGDSEVLLLVWVALGVLLYRESKIPDLVRRRVTE